MLYQYSDTVFAIRLFNDAKDREDFYSCQIVTRACHTFITYLFAARPGEWRHVADASAVAEQRNPATLLQYN